jgi:hypothetical protein
MKNPAAARGPASPGSRPAPGHTPRLAAHGRRRNSGAPARARTQPAVDLRIEELVLHGFSPHDRWAIGDSLERELGRLLAERELPHGIRRERAIGSLDGGSFAALPGRNPERIGEDIARAVFGGLSK